MIKAPVRAREDVFQASYSMVPGDTSRSVSRINLDCPLASFNPTPPADSMRALLPRERCLLDGTHADKSHIRGRLDIAGRLWVRRPGTTA